MENKAHFVPLTRPRNVQYNALIPAFKSHFYLTKQNNIYVPRAPITPLGTYSINNSELFALPAE